MHAKIDQDELSVFQDLVDEISLLVSQSYLGEAQGRKDKLSNLSARASRILYLKGAEIKMQRKV